MVKRPRGTRDFTPSEMKRRLHLEKILEDVASRHGFNRVQTPIFESLELFTAKSGPGVVSQLYSFDDKGGRPLTLRPELTAPVMRMVAEEMRNEPKPLRLSYYGQCFRYEEFKRGRYREFYQYGLELIGASGPLADAEVVATAVDMLHTSGLKDWELRIGHVGVLHDVLSGMGLPVEGETESPIASAMRFLDKGDWTGLENLFANHGVSGDISGLRQLSELDGGVETLPEAEQIISSLGVSSDAISEMSTMLAYLETLAESPPSLKVNFTVARGLDYYTGMVFEVMVDELGGEGQVLGGGTYRLMHLFNQPDLDPCSGFGLGFDRVLLALEMQAKSEGRNEIVPGDSEGGIDVVMIPFKVDAEIVLPIAKHIRESGLRVEIELRSRKIGKSMGWADSLNAKFALIVGPNDLEAGKCSIRRLSDGEQSEVSLDGISVLGLLTTLS